MFSIEAYGSKTLFSLLFRKIGPCYKYFWSQNDIIGNYFMLRSTNHKEGPRNPSAPILVNAFRTTNFRSSSAMHGAEIHGNTRRDCPTRILGMRVGQVGLSSDPMRGNRTFCCRLVNIILVLATNSNLSKRLKV